MDLNEGPCETMLLKRRDGSRRRVGVLLTFGWFVLAASVATPVAFTSAWAQKAGREWQGEARPIAGPPRTLPAGGVPYFVVTSAFAGASGDFQNTIACDAASELLVITHGACTGIQNNTRACLGDGRFLVWATFTSPSGPGAGVPTDAQVVPFGASDSAMFWFFGPQNWELLAKVLNFCGEVEHAHRLFAAGTTTVNVTVSVLDVINGGTAQISNPQFSSFQNQVVPIANSCP